MRVRTAALLLVLLASSAAGCLAADDGGPDAPRPAAADDGEGAATAPSTEAPETARAAGGGKALYRFEAPAARTTFWKNGTFAPHETCATTGVPGGLNSGLKLHQQAVDITDKVPAGVPVVLTAELIHDGVALHYIELQADPADAYSVSDSGNSVYARLLRTSDAPVQVMVGASTPDAAPETAYALRITVETRPDLLLPGAPVALPLEGGARLTVAPKPQEGTPTVLLWSPSGTLMDRYTADAPGNLTIAIPEHAPQGDYTVMVTAPEGGAQLAATGPTPGARSLRALPVEVVKGEPRPLVANGPTEWTFTVDRAPIAVGLALEAGPGPYSTGDAVQGEARSPQGAVVTVDEETAVGFSLNLCFTVGDHVWWSQPGDAALTPGDYTATLQTERAANVHVYELVRTWRR